MNIPENDITAFNNIYSQLFKEEEKEKKAEHKENYQELLIKQVPLINAERNIFVYGTDLQPRIQNVSEANFTEVIYNNLFKYGYRSVFPIQSYCWNEIIDGRSVTIVNDQNSGKTMTFLPPLLSLLSVKSKPHDEATQGPIAIVITNTSREVEALYCLCRQLLPIKDVKIVKSFGIWNFKDKCIELLNGCDLLITTPSCFTRFTESVTIKMFDRKIIKYLVLENLDLMYEKFKTELEVILKICTTGTEFPKNNPQIIITATCWQDFLNSFSKFSTNPVIIIDPYIEAALFAKSRFTISRKSIKEKDQQILSYFGQYEWRHHKTAVVFSQQDEIDNFQTLLSSRSLAFEILDRSTLEYNIEVWNCQKAGKMTILLILDSVLTHVNIECIQILIHYSLPETWSAFSRRFALSVDYYKSYKDLTLKNKENQPRAIINLDENNVNEIPRIIHFLSDRRLVQQIPAHIQNEAQRIKNDLEKAKSDPENKLIVPLCSNILKFASCSRYKCLLRHAFIPSDEPEFIPRCGKIKFKLIKMNSPLHLVMTITHYLAPNSSNWISYRDKNKVIKQGLKCLQDYMINDENQVMDIPIIGNLYAYYNTIAVQWQRCKIIQLIENPNSLNSRKAYVEFIDFGGCSSVNTTTLMKLPDEIKQLDPLACDLRIINLIPYDCDEIFDRETIEIVEKYIFTAQKNCDYMMCDIELAAGHTIITTNVTAHKMLNNIKIDIVNLSMKKYLVENKFALHQNVLDRLIEIAVNSNFYKIIEKLQKIESDVEKLNEIKIQEQKKNLKELSIGRTYNVTLLSFEKPESIYVQVIDKNLIEIKSNLMVIEKYQAREQLKSYQQNAICLYKSEDGKMKRCEIIKNEPLEVLLIDFGIKVKPILTNLYEIPNEMISLLPFQAIQCGIKGLKSKGIITLDKILAFKRLFKKISKNEIFEIKVHSKAGDKYIVSAYDTDDNKLSIKELTVKQKLCELTKEEIQKEQMKNETEYFIKLLENEENVNLYQSDVNNLIGLPPTARFLPPKEIQKMLKDSNEDIPLLKAIEQVQNVPESKAIKSVENMKESKPIPQKSGIRVLKILELIKKAEEAQKPEISPEKVIKLEKETPEKMELKLKNLFSPVKIEWNQNQGIIMFRIEAVDMLEYSLKVTKTRCEICIKYDNKTAVTNIELYGRVIPKHVVHESHGRYITIFLIKKFLGVFWPRLTLSNVKNNNIKYSSEDFKITSLESNVDSNLKPKWAAAGYFSDNEDNYYCEYDDKIEDDEDQV